MHIDVRCDGCERTYRVAAEHAGKRMRCKGCGQSVTVPTPAAAPDPGAEDDLFALAPEPDAPAPRVPKMRVPLPSPPPLPTAAYAPRSVASTSSQVVDAGPRAGAAVADAYVPISHEPAIDRILPFGIIGLFVLILIILAGRSVSQVLSMGRSPNIPPDAVAQAVGRVIGIWIGVAAGVAAIAAPLCLLGIVIASRLIGFPNRPRLYWRCLAVVCAPTALAGTIGLLFGIAPWAAETSWYFGIVTLIVALWLVLRLRPGPFAATAGFVLFFTVAVPLAIVLAVVMVAGSSKPGGPVATAAPPAPSAPHVPPPGSRERKYSPAKPGEADDPELDESRRKLTGQEKYAMQAVETRMRKIGQAIAEYAARHQGKYPNSLGELVNAGLITMNERGESFDRYTYAASSYVRYPGPAQMIVVERQYAGYPRHTVLFGDGRVESIEPARWGQVREASSDAIRKRTAEQSSSGH